MRLCYLYLNYSNYTVKSSHAYNTWGTKIVPDEYRVSSLERICAYSTSAVVEYSGKIGIRDWGITGSQFQSDLIAHFVWKY